MVKIPVLNYTIMSVIDEVELVGQAKPNSITKRCTTKENSKILKIEAIILTTQHYISLSVPTSILIIWSYIRSKGTTLTKKCSRFLR